MFSKEILAFEDLENFNYKETKKNIEGYFQRLKRLKWEWEKINGQNRLVSNYDFTVGYQKQRYTPIGKDMFNQSKKESKEEQLNKCLSCYHQAESALSDDEQLYIRESFVNRKSQDELAESLGFSGSDNHEYRRLKKSAVYKFADFLDLIIEKK